MPQVPGNPVRREAPPRGRPPRLQAFQGQRALSSLNVLPCRDANQRLVRCASPSPLSLHRTAACSAPRSSVSVRARSCDEAKDTTVCESEPMQQGLSCLGRLAISRTGPARPRCCTWGRGQHRSGPQRPPPRAGTVEGAQWPPQASTAENASGLVRPITMGNPPMGLPA